MFEFGILGGGLAGWTLAQELCQRGVSPEDICLFEQHSPCSGSSGVLRALMHPFTGRTLYPKEGYLDFWRYSLNWLSKLQTQSETALSHETRLWRIALSEKVERQFSRSFARAQTLEGYPLREISPADLPAQGVRKAYELQRAAHASMPRIVAHLARTTAVQRQLNLGPLRPQKTADHWLIQSQEQNYACQNLILAPGSGLEKLCPQLPLSYKRGEVAIFDMPGQLPAAISGEGRYVASIAPHRHIVGATFYMGSRPWSAPQSWWDLKARLPWLAGIHGAQLKQIWTGVRAICPDKEPLVGPLSKGLWLHTGYATRGLLMIPQCSAWLAQALTQGPNQLPERVNPRRIDPALYGFGES